MGDDTPEKLYARTWLATVNSFMRVHSFQALSAEGIRHSAPKILDEYIEFSKELFSSPEYDKLFNDKAAVLEMLGGYELSGQKMAANTIKQYQEAVDSAALVFCHSILDNAVFEYCRISALISLESWEPYISTKQVTLEQMKKASYDDILKEKVDAALRVLERESLLTKIDRLFAICKPPKGFSPIKEYTYNRARIEALDESRHKIIHSNTFQTSIPVKPDDVQYYMGTANYLMTLLNEAFDLKVDPEAMFSVFPSAETTFSSLRDMKTRETKG